MGSGLARPRRKLASSAWFRELLREGPRASHRALLGHEGLGQLRLAPRILRMSPRFAFVSYSDNVRTGASDAVGYSGSYFRSRRCRAYRHKQSLKPRHAQKSMPSMRHQVAGRAETSLRLQERGVSECARRRRGRILRVEAIWGCASVSYSR